MCPVGGPGRAFVPGRRSGARTFVPGRRSGGGGDSLVEPEDRLLGAAGDARGALDRLGRSWRRAHRARRRHGVGLARARGDEPDRVASGPSPRRSGRCAPAAAWGSPRQATTIASSIVERRVSGEERGHVAVGADRRASAPRTIRRRARAPSRLYAARGLGQGHPGVARRHLVDVGRVDTDLVEEGGARLDRRCGRRSPRATKRSSPHHKTTRDQSTAEAGESRPARGAARRRRCRR